MIDIFFYNNIYHKIIKLKNYFLKRINLGIIFKMEIKDIFIEICKFLPLKSIIKLELLSKRQKNIIRTYPWMHFMVRLGEYNYEYVLKNYNFKKIRLWIFNYEYEKILINKNILKSTSIPKKSIKFGSLIYNLKLR